MGQKIHPKGLRVGIIKDSDSKWLPKDYSFLLRFQFASSEEKLFDAASLIRMSVRQRAAHLIQLQNRNGYGRGGPVEDLRKPWRNDRRAMLTDRDKSLTLGPVGGKHAAHWRPHQ